MISALPERYLYWGQESWHQLLTADDIAHRCEEESQRIIQILFTSLSSRIQSLETRSSKQDYHELVTTRTHLGSWMCDRKLSFSPVVYDLPDHFWENYVYLVTAGLKDRDLQAIFYRSSKLLLRKTQMSPKEVARVLAGLAGSESTHSDNERSRATASLESALSSSKVFAPIAPICEFEELDTYNCAACHPTNPSSLHMMPTAGPDNTAQDTIIFPPRCESYNGIVHGGFLTMVLDEIMVYSLVLHRQKVALTTEMTVSFKRPVYVGKPYKLLGTLVNHDTDRCQLAGKILSESGHVCAEAHGDFIIPDAITGARIFGKSLTEHPIARKYFNIAEAQK